MLNKGLALYQWKRDVGAAERWCLDALKIDPEFEPAIATLAELNLRQKKVDTAIELFQRKSKLARSKSELEDTLACMYISIAEKTFLEVNRCCKIDDWTAN